MSEQSQCENTMAAVALTDAHTHLDHAYDNVASRRFVCAAGSADWAALENVREMDVAFYGMHPWFAAEWNADALARLEQILASHPRAGVGEIGLDRLRDRTVSSSQREAFEAQLKLAARFHRPVALHGAKCWGEVVKACRPFVGEIPAFLFHGFSRSDGLLPEIFAMNGFVSVNASILNEHAVNYREMARRLPRERVLVESDGKEGVDLAAIAAALGVEVEALNANAAQFVEALA